MTATEVKARQWKTALPSAASLGSVTRSLMAGSDVLAAVAAAEGAAEAPGTPPCGMPCMPGRKKAPHKRILTSALLTSNDSTESGRKKTKMARSTRQDVAGDDCFGDSHAMPVPVSLSHFLPLCAPAMMSPEAGRGLTSAPAAPV